MELNEITERIIGCAIKIHKALYRVFLKTHTRFAWLTNWRSLASEFRQVALPVIYDGIKLDAGYRIDLLVEDAVIVELKAVDSIHPIHEAQVISYLKLSGKKIGLLINFNVKLLTSGVRRLAN